MALQDSVIITNVQKRLLELGYSGGGEPDGVLSLKTQGSILNFRNRNGLPLVPTIDDQLLACLEKAPMIEVPVAQATATVAQIAPRVEAVQKAWWAKAWTHVLAWPAGLVTVVLGVVNNLGDAITK